MVSNSPLPFRVQVSDVIESRYPGHRKPMSWDERKDGVDTVCTAQGKKIKLISDGGQSPPKPGWEILITSGDDASGYRWTLYGIH